MTVSDEEWADRYLRRNPELAGAIAITPDKARGFLKGEPTDAAEAPDEAPEPRGKTAEKPDEAPNEPPEPSNEANEEPATPSEHYDRLGELYATLGEIDGWHCPGNRDFYGWYRTRQGPGAWDGKGRAWALGKEFVGT